MARSLTPRDFAMLAGVMVVQLFLLTLQNALITGPYLVLQARQRPEERERYTASLFYVQLSFIMIVAFTGQVVMGLFLPSWPALVKAGVLLWGTSSLVQDFIRRIFLARGQARYALAIDGLTNGLQWVLLVCLAALHQMTLSAGLLVMGGTFLPSIVLGLYLIRPGSWDGDGFCRTIRVHVREGKWLLPTAILQWWSGNAFIVAAGYWLGPGAFGALRLGQSLFGVVSVLLQAFENYTLPRASALSASEMTAYLRRVFVRGAGYVLLLLLIPALLAAPLFRLSGGSSYMPYYRVLQELSLLYAVIYAGYPIRIAIRALSLNQAFFIGYVLSSGISLLAVKPMICQWGIEGAISGLIINQLIMTGCWIYTLKKKLSYGDNTCSPGQG